MAIAGRQTGVYPCESPGGWNLLGRTPLRIADARWTFPSGPATGSGSTRSTHVQFEARRDERL